MAASLFWCLNFTFPWCPEHYPFTSLNTLHSSCGCIFLFSYYKLGILKAKTVLFTSSYPQGPALCWYIVGTVCWVGKGRAAPLYFRILPFTNNKTEAEISEVDLPKTYNQCGEIDTGPLMSRICAQYSFHYELLKSVNINKRRERICLCVKNSRYYLLPSDTMRNVSFEFHLRKTKDATENVWLSSAQWPPQCWSTCMEQAALVSTPTTESLIGNLLNQYPLANQNQANKSVHLKGWGENFQ